VTTAAELARAVEAALAQVRGAPGLTEAEVFAADNGGLSTRLSYTSHIPCNGVEEPKSTRSLGIGIRAVFASAEGALVGFGSEPSDLGPAGVARALERARRAAVRDPQFVSLPDPSSDPAPLAGYHDPRLMTLDDTRLVELGWTVVNGALRTFMASSRLAALAGSEEALPRLGLIVGGDVTVLQERIAIASTRAPAPRTDESTLITAFVTAMVEARDGKGSGWSTGTRLDHFTDEAGVQAAQRAIDAVDGVRVPSGRYTVVFGHQPVADLLNNLIVPACASGAIYTSSTPFLGKLGRPVAHPSLTIYDDGARPGLMGSKAITCEGLPTGRTDLIRDGAFVGCLASWYDAQRLLRDPDLAAKLGASADAAAGALTPRNGFRFGPGGGRQFDGVPHAAPTNVIVESSAGVSRDELLRRVGDGLYVGRIWYTYPINGLRAGDFTCTVVADSYRIRDGRLAEPLRPNTLRIDENLTRVLNEVVGVTKDVKGTIVWAADEVAYVPEIAVRDVHVREIASFMEDLS
jgi:PmbA protein